MELICCASFLQQGSQVTQLPKPSQQVPTPRCSCTHSTPKQTLLPLCASAPGEAAKAVLTRKRSFYLIVCTGVRQAQCPSNPVSSGTCVRKPVKVYQAIIAAFGGLRGQVLLPATYGRPLCVAFCTVFRSQSLVVSFGMGTVVLVQLRDVTKRCSRLQMSSPATPEHAWASARLRLKQLLHSRRLQRGLGSSARYNAPSGSPLQPLIAQKASAVATRRTWGPQIK